MTSDYKQPLSSLIYAPPPTAVLGPSQGFFIVFFRQVFLEFRYLLLGWGCVYILRCPILYCILSIAGPGYLFIVTGVMIAR